MDKDKDRILKICVEIPTYGKKSQMLTVAAHAMHAIKLSVCSQAVGRTTKDGKLIPSVDQLLGKDDIGGGEDIVHRP